MTRKTEATALAVARGREADSIGRQRTEKARADGVVLVAGHVGAARRVIGSRWR